MKNILNICAVLLAILSPVIVGAMEVTVNGVSVTLDYEEPTTNADLTSALTDLDHTSIYYDLGSGFVEADRIPATSATGGGHITAGITVPAMEGQEKDVRFKTTATDNSGNESADSNIVTKRIDRLAPAAPK
ncbi:MAG: hypothetical protein C4560_02955 [Nitrospiraceae bacterium]|nr:MAG: hypothetical protein C4560_02955 [Nitrospiraceae bacterium]